MHNAEVPLQWWQQGYHHKTAYLFDYRKTLPYSHCPASYLADRPTLVLITAIPQFAILNFTCMWVSHSTHQQIQQVPKTECAPSRSSSLCLGFLFLRSPMINTGWHPTTLSSLEGETTGLCPGFIHPLKAHEIGATQKALVHSGKNYMPSSSSISSTGCVQIALMPNTNFELASPMLKQLKNCVKEAFR